MEHSIDSQVKGIPDRSQDNHERGQTCTILLSNKFVGGYSEKWKVLTTSTPPKKNPQHIIVNITSNFLIYLSQDQWISIWYSISSGLL